MSKQPKKYIIKEPKQCKTCNQASDCLFLQQLHQKPFDTTGIIINCKAFYSVFCMLKDMDNSSLSEDSEGDRTFHETGEKGICLYLPPAMITNGMLAAELALKAMTLKETGTFACVHDIYELFYSLPQEHLEALSSIIKAQTHQNDTTLKMNLEVIRDFFEKWRYSFQEWSIGYSSFPIEFIQIVCDYALADYENDRRSIE